MAKLDLARREGRPGFPIADDPGFHRIAQYALGMTLLSPELRAKYAQEYGMATAFDELSSGAQYAWEVAKSKIESRPEPIRLDDTYENRHWLTPTPEMMGIGSKDGLMRYLDLKGMSLAQFKETPLYRMNQKAWDEMGV